MRLLKSNQIQVELIKDSGIKTEIWIKLYSKTFRNIVIGGEKNIEYIKNELYK